MSIATAADTLLRSREPHRLVAELRRSDLIGILICGGFVYGVVMGGFAMRPLQMLYSGLKVPMLLTASALICLPNFFVVNTLLGLRGDFSTVLRGLIGTQLTMALVLAALAPLTATAYLSSPDYRFSIVWNGAMFLVASLMSHVQLGRVYAPLIAANSRHRIAKAVWLLLYVIITIQLAWMLRPFIGSRSLDTTFFRQGVWDNAYVVVIDAVWKLVSR